MILQDEVPSIISMKDVQRGVFCDISKIHYIHLETIESSVLLNGNRKLMKCKQIAIVLQRNYNMVCYQVNRQ